MIDTEMAQKEFDKYARQYDLNNENLNRKYYHTYRVVNNCEDVAKSLNLSEEEIKLAKLIGLLHDIARFEQWERYQTFSDAKSIDHGNFGVEILQKNKFIRNFIKEDSYDNIIIKAIKNHNKFKIEEGLNEKELLFTKIIRDADKIDILNESLTLFFKRKEEIEEIENGQIQIEVFNQICQEKPLLRKLNHTQFDRVLGYLCFVFDVNFKYSFHVVYNEDYINKLIDRFDYKNMETKEKMEEIRIIINNYILNNK